MTHQKFDNQYVIRLFPGEEIKESIRQFCATHRIKGAWFIGLGAVGECELNFFNLNKKQYTTKKFKKELEITNLHGNITHDGIVHTHGVFSDHTMHSIGGHIERAVISVTGEIVLTSLKSKLSRTFDSQTGLKLLQFE